MVGRLIYNINNKKLQTMSNLDLKIQYLGGVGPKVSSKLEKLGIETVEDLLFYFPRAYQDYTKITSISDVIPTGMEESSNKRSLDYARDDTRGRFTIRGRIVGIENKRTSRRRFTVTEAVVEDGTGSIKVVWFNQPFLVKMLPAGREVILNGKVEINPYSQEIVMQSPNRATSPKIVPIYSETAGITSFFIARLFAKVKPMIEEIEDFLPENIIEKYGLLPLQEAIRSIHEPKNSEMLKRAERRLGFDELFLISIKGNLSKEEIKKENAPEINVGEKEIANYVESLPFELTEDQKKATWQILKDMEKPTPMNRLLNGDVGSGKTVVAAIAAYAAVKAGFRVAIMAPTSILASQHFDTMCKLFEGGDISIGLLTSERQDSSEFRISNFESISNSKISKKEQKTEVLSANIIIGTQALIQEKVRLENIGLIIVDEQHRFGVKQRATLAKLSTFNFQPSTRKEMHPHFLSMTATPIPRTMHLALFGDLDLTLIREKPKDRKEIKTKFVESANRQKAYEFIRNQIKAGRQCFVICPLIKEKEGEILESLFDEEKKSVMKEYEKLRKEIFPELYIGFLHGKLKSKEKDEVMGQFSKGSLNILVSTSVVEVGVDIPNATVMMIEDAERFGLAQIHQFRGRVGRAEHQSFCFLFSTTASAKALSRLKSLEVTSDGFKLAEIDLETRGPGAIFGLEQSGLLDLKMASLSDRALIEEASSAAKTLIEEDSELTHHPLLKEKISSYMQTKHME